jgi:hypothetical protein
MPTLGNVKMNIYISNISFELNSPGTVHVCALVFSDDNNSPVQISCLINPDDMPMSGDAIYARIARVTPAVWNNDASRTSIGDNDRFFAMTDSGIFGPF